VLVIAELATSMVLIVGALILARSLANLMRTDIGVATDHTLAAFIDLNLGRSSTLDASAETDRVNAILDRVNYIPGVRSAAIATSLPPAITRLRTRFTLARAAQGVAPEFLADLALISPTYFLTMS